MSLSLQDVGEGRSGPLCWRHRRRSTAVCLPYCVSDCSVYANSAEAFVEAYRRSQHSARVVCNTIPKPRQPRKPSAEAAEAPEAAYRMGSKAITALIAGLPSLSNLASVAFTASSRRPTAPARWSTSESARRCQLRNLLFRIELEKPCVGSRVFR